MWNGWWMDIDWCARKLNEQNKKNIHYFVKHSLLRKADIHFDEEKQKFYYEYNNNKWYLGDYVNELVDDIGQHYDKVYNKAQNKKLTKENYINYGSDINNNSNEIRPTSPTSLQKRLRISYEGLSPHDYDLE